MSMDILFCHRQSSYTIGTRQVHEWNVLGLWPPHLLRFWLVWNFDLVLDFLFCVWFFPPAPVREHPHLTKVLGQPVASHMIRKDCSRFCRSWTFCNLHGEHVPQHVCPLFHTPNSARMFWGTSSPAPRWRFEFRCFSTFPNRHMLQYEVPTAW